MSILLIIDDQEKTLNSVKRMFVRGGHSVVGAQDAATATNIFSKSVSKINAVVIDLRLTDPSVGDRGGFELACRFRSYNKFVPIFIYSASVIEDSIKDDPRINKTYQKGGNPDEDINVEEITKLADSYWDDFHRDDPSELIGLKSKFDLTEEVFLKLVEPKTPLRHEKIVDLLFQQDSWAGSIASDDRINEWNFVGLEKTTMKLTGSNDERKELVARVSFFEKDKTEHKAMFTSLPTLFAYGRNKKEASSHLKELCQSIFTELNETSRAPKINSVNLDGVDFLRLKSFFHRVT